MRAGSSDGLSLRTWQLGVAVGLAWALHGIRSGFANIVVSNLFAAAIATLIVTMIARDRRLSTVSVWTLPALATAALGVVEFAAPSVVFGIACTIPLLTGQFAQTVELVRSPSVTGVSLAYVTLNALVPTMWLLWALFSRDSAVLFTSSVVGAASVFNLVWLLGRRFEILTPRTAQPAHS